MESIERIKISFPIHMVRNLRDSEQSGFGGISTPGLRIVFAGPGLYNLIVEGKLVNKPNVMWKLEASGCAYCGGNAYFTPVNQENLAWYDFCTCGD